VNGAIGQYLSKSRACLDKLVGIIEQGSERSVSLWESQCKLAEGQLVALAKVEGLTTSVGGWFIDEVNAWSRMASVGRGICYVNELLVKQIVHLQWCRDQTEQEKKTVARQVKDSVREVLTEIGKEARDVLNGAEKMDQLLDDVGLEEGAKGLREIVDVSSAFDDDVEELLDLVERVSSTQRYIELLADSMRRRKTRFLQDNDRLLVRLRQDLARLVSAKIDPDGRGVYDQYEKRIERAALKNLDEYEAELQKWKAANATFLGNALEFGKTFVNPAVSSAADLVPYGGGALVFVKLVKMAGSFIEAVDPFLESVRRQADRKSGAALTRVMASARSIRESLQELKDEKDVKLLALEKQRRRDATDFDVASKDELRTLKTELAKYQAELKGLPDDEEDTKATKRRVELEELIDETEQRIRAEPVALKRRHAHYKKKTEALKKALAAKYDERIERMEKRIKETEAVGGAIK
jgi:hypothetical protein